MGYAFTWICLVGGTWSCSIPGLVNIFTEIAVYLRPYSPTPTWAVKAIETFQRQLNFAFTLKMGFIDPSFKNIKLGQSNFIIWRVENFELKPVQPSRHGSFHEGDSYIVYSAAPPVEKFEHNQLRGAQGKLEYHIHFWLGSRTSVDESTTAAIKSVELDEILNGLGVQHREVQGHESQRFRSYFKKGIRILKGGVASGLHHVTDDFKARLFKIKGKRRPILTEQSSVSWDHFNSGDVFILETKKNIFVWIGKDSNKMEKFQAGKVAAQLRSEGPEKTIVYVEEDLEGWLNEEDLKEFDEHLKLSERTIKPAESDVGDTQSELAASRGIKLFRCTDQGGTFNTILVKDGPLKQGDLSPEDSFIVDNNVNGIWVWIGKKASAEERSKGMTTAFEFIKTNNYPETTSVTRVVDGAEPIEFQMLFLDWKHPNASLNYNRQNSGKTVNMHFDAAKLHDTPALAAGTQLIDNGTGVAKVWRLRDKELEAVPEDDFGVFFSGDCYLVLYTYDLRGRQKQLLYFWLGSHSSQDERGRIAWHAIKKDDELNGLPVQVRVVQSKEPPHFLIIFKGKMIVFKGGYASSFDGPEGKDVGIPSRYLIQVRGGEEHTTQSVEVELSASSLNSNDVFVLHTEKKTYVWCGKGSTGDEREMAKIIAEERSLTKDYQLLLEGHENSEFWDLLGGQQPYHSNERLCDPEITPARLFHCSNSSGYFKAEEVYDFSQYDLIPSDVMVLDIGKAVFIWVGQGTNKEERTEAPKLVEEYLKTDPRGRDLDIPVITIQQGNEPPNFTGFFGAWDPKLWESSLYKELGSDVSAESKGKPVNGETKVSSGQISKYPISELANKAADELPDDVDVLHRELHLSEEDFVATFGMKRAMYDRLPSWKQNNLKKSVGLF